MINIELFSVGSRGEFFSLADENKYDVDAAPPPN
jgi:hypothetical protein